MCGLVGVVCKRPNGFSKEHQDIFSTLLFVDTLRGYDSTGVFVVTNDGDVSGAKDEGMGPKFMTTKEYDELHKKAWNRGSAMIGHNRAATRGVVNDQNAHPFIVDDNIVLVHNGTMRSDHKKHADVEVDSHAIAHLIHEKGTVAEALGAFYGAYALIWYNVNEGKLHMIRNHERPLFWMELDDAWVWSSEKCMLEFAAARTNAKVKTEPTSLPEDHLQTFELSNKGWKVSAEKLDIKKSVPYVSGGSGGGNRSQGYYDEWAAQMYDDDNGIWGYPGAQPPFRQDPTAQMLSDAQWEERRREAEWEERRREAMRRQRGGADYDPERKGNTVVQLLPAPKPQQQQPKHTGSGSDNARRMVEAREPMAFPGLEDRERAMAIKLNKLISHRHYSNIILHTHPYNTTVLCVPFEYGYVNGRDSSNGYYLYASPFDDEDIILRQFFDNNVVTEERMIQIAGCEYVYEFTLKQREWRPVNPADLTNGKFSNDTEGYCLIRCGGAKLVSSGQQNVTSH